MLRVWSGKAVLYEVWGSGRGVGCPHGGPRVQTGWCLWPLGSSFWFTWLIHAHLSCMLSGPMFLNSIQW